jgi:predicted nucleotidyltransferase
VVEVTTTLQRIISKYKKALAELGIHVTEVYLYGSQKTGKATEDSDIDLIIVSPDFSDKDTFARLEILGVAAARIMQPVQAYGVTPDEIKKRKLSIFWRTMLEKEAVAV